MNEFELIARLTRNLPANATTRVGPGDDCAVLDTGRPGCWTLLKTDAVVAGVHFDPAAPPQAIGHKALARCLSDVAAMAGTPTHAVVTLGLPQSFDVPFLEQIYAGMIALANRHAVAIVGGETTANPDRLLLSIALLGEVPVTRCLLRSGARPGDALFVTGELGGSLVSGKHLSFEPRLAEARWLAEHFTPHAMIDLSDGLAGDLPHLLKASGVGAELLAAAIPISPAARRSRHTLTPAKTPLAAALTDGEDFELLFAVDRRQAVPLRDAWAARFPGLALSCIGTVTSTPGITLRDCHGDRPLTEHGYVHFQQP